MTRKSVVSIITRVEVLAGAKAEERKKPARWNAARIHQGKREEEMYETIEAELKDGTIVPLEPGRVPTRGRALVTILREPSKKHDWAEVRRHLGWLKRQVNGVAWQRDARSEWGHRP